jgi:hypothetical protein
MSLPLQKSRAAWLLSLTLGGTSGKEAIATGESDRARNQVSFRARSLVCI